MPARADRDRTLPVEHYIIKLLHAQKSEDRRTPSKSWSPNKTKQRLNSTANRQNQPSLMKQQKERPNTAKPNHSPAGEAA